MSDPEVVYVLCCDDEYDELQFDTVFNADWERRRARGDQRRLCRYGTVRPSLVAATGALETADRAGEVPRVVLIDDWLKGPAGSRDPVPSAFELVRWTATRFEPERRPLCILQTSRVTPPMAYAFCEQGGAHVIDKQQKQPDWSTRVDVVWSAVDGERWRHAPAPPLVRFTQRDYDILPYLDADKSPNEIAAALGLKISQVHWSRSELYRRLGGDKEPGDPGRLVDFALSGHSKPLAAAALAAGAIWVPLEYRVDSGKGSPTRPEDSNL